MTLQDFLQKHRQADHGTCLTCGQLIHGRHHEKHDYLTAVPWFEVPGTV